MQTFPEGAGPCGRFSDAAPSAAASPKKRPPGGDRFDFYEKFSYSCTCQQDFPKKCFGSPAGRNPEKDHRAEREQHPPPHRASAAEGDRAPGDCQTAQGLPEACFGRTNGSTLELNNIPYLFDYQIMHSIIFVI